jgi:hypothetical protein
MPTYGTGHTWADALSCAGRNMIAANVQPKWKKQPTRPSLTGKHWM